MAKKSPDIIAIERLTEALNDVVKLAQVSGSTTLATRIRRALHDFANQVENARAITDRIRLPKVTFDPFEPKTVGRMVALATIAQPRVPLSGVPDAYGSGVYAIYYVGDHPLYSAITRTETPIYVGKADPLQPTASGAREQGARLTGRLHEHADTIAEVDKYAEARKLVEGLNQIELTDFDCRRLACATNAQLVAEVHLIRMFWPLWNSQTKACWGMSKHGDSASTRKNKRSPWDVVHPGRPWALDDRLENSLSPEEIRNRINAVLVRTPPRQDYAALLGEMLAAFSQDDQPEEPLISPLGPQVEGPEPDEAGEEI